MNPIRIGIFGDGRGWQLLLDQEGLPSTSIQGEFAVGAYSAVVAGDAINEEDVELIRNYLEAGGGVLCSGRVFARVSGTPCREERIRYICPEPNSEFSGIGFVDVSAPCCVPGHAATVRDQNGKFVILVGEFGSGRVVVLPFDAGEIVLDGRVMTKSFYASRSRLPFETVSLVTKNGVRKLVARSLELLHHLRGLPYVHAWYFPSGARSLFALRIDTDYSGESEIEGLSRTLHASGVPLTWFADVKSQEKIISSYTKMEGDEIGIHCYNHTTYSDYRRNVENIRTAVAVFEKHGIEARSFAAPYGTWNNGIARAIEHCGFEYSSEFSYDYDDFPSFPFLEGECSQTLQVPIHPISIGSLGRQGFGEQEMTEYFQGVLKRKLSHREPVFLYHHPGNGHENVLREMIDVVRREGISAVRMIDYARWWKKRSASFRGIAVDGQSLNVTIGTPADDVFLHLTLGDGRESFVPARLGVEMDSLEWSERPRPLPLPPDADRVRKFNPWIPLHRLEDFVFGIFKTKS
ncbi:MAG: polysaccharide deacetylase family protein [Bacteroidota bacterium]